MDYILEKELNSEIFTDEYEYFFTFLSDRFEYAVELWIKELEKKFNKKFRPIWILSAKQNEFFEKENYIVINKKIKELREKIHNNNIVYLEDYEDLNKEFSESEFIKKLIEKLIKKQNRVFILSFTSSWLKIQNSKVKILGPLPKIATKFDDKTRHVKLFHFLDLPRNKIRIYKNIEDIKLNEEYPFYISASYTSGGHESKIIYTEKDLDIFYLNLREINKSNSFLVANLIKNIKLSPNINAIVYDKNDTRIICITDQILRENQYLGNIYPSKTNEKEKKVIIETTKKVGNYLSGIGFRGLFGLDFIIDYEENIYIVDLNPRRQGGYLCNILMSKINIPEIELKLALGEKVPNFDYEDFQVNYCWAHSKIKPYFSNTRILNIFRIGNPFQPFFELETEYKTIFYPEKYLLASGNAGYLIVSGNNYEEVKDRIIKETEISISKNFELYDGIL